MSPLCKSSSKRICRRWKERDTALSYTYVSVASDTAKGEIGCEIAIEYAHPSGVLPGNEQFRDAPASGRAAKRTITAIILRVLTVARNSHKLDCRLDLPYSNIVIYTRYLHIIMTTVPESLSNGMLMRRRHPMPGSHSACS